MDNNFQLLKQKKMKKYILITTMAVGVMILSTSCVKELFGCISGEGSIETRVVQFDEISGFDVFGSNNITIIEGSEQVIEITSFPNIIDAWLDDTFVEDGILNAGIEGCVTGFNSSDINIKATINRLDLIAISGSGDVQTSGVFNNVRNLEIDIVGSGDLALDLGEDMGDIDVKISGNGDVELSGKANSSDIRISGSGKIENYALEVVEADISISGSGDAEVLATERLAVQISGSGDVCYLSLIHI